MSTAFTLECNGVGFLHTLLLGLCKTHVACLCMCQAACHSPAQEGAGVCSTQDVSVLFHGQHIPEAMLPLTGVSTQGSPTTQPAMGGIARIPQMGRKKQENRMVTAISDQEFSLKISLQRLNFWMGWDIITPCLWLALEFSKALSHTLSHFILITTW